MALSIEKWLAMALLTVLSIILGLIPYYIVRFTKTALRTDSTVYKVVLTILSCFGGGVLFSTAVMHLLPEIREKATNVPALWNTFDAHFPVAEMLMLAGFLLIYLVEEVAHFIMVDGHHNHHHHTNTIARHNSIAHGIPIPNGDISGRSRSRNASLAISHATTEDERTAQDSSQFNAFRNGGNGLGKPRFVHEEEEECPDDKTNLTSSLRAGLALIALSFHAIMEGVAIGLKTSTGVWVMFGAVASHKFVISFCMGMELMNSQARLLTYIGSIVFFAIVSPIGIIIGSLIAENTTNADNLLVVVIEGMVCGTLLYVVFFEILNRERERKSYSMPNSKAIGFIQFIALAAGIIGMGVLSTLTHDDHGLDHDDHSSDCIDDGHDH